MTFDLNMDAKVAAAIERANGGQWARHEGYELLMDEIEKAEFDERQYRIIKLDNGLVLILIHDSGADKAAAALDVAVGHLHDPVRSPPGHSYKLCLTLDSQDEMPGLAHFCEHLLFMVSCQP